MNSSKTLRGWASAVIVVSIITAIILACNFVTVVPGVPIDEQIRLRGTADITLAADTYEPNWGIIAAFVNILLISFLAASLLNHFAAMGDMLARIEYRMVQGETNANS